MRIVSPVGHHHVPGAAGVNLCSLDTGKKSIVLTYKAELVNLHGKSHLHFGNMFIEC